MSSSSKELVLIDQQQLTPPKSKSDKHKSTENVKNEKVKEPPKISSEENIGQNKIIQLLNSTDSLKPKNGITYFTAGYASFAFKI